MNERVISKVNRSGTVLKLSNSPNLNSIYPMIDEFGYTTIDYFIFKSTWDYEYYLECIIPSSKTLTSNTNILNP